MKFRTFNCLSDSELLKVLNFIKLQVLEFLNHHPAKPQCFYLPKCPTTHEIKQMDSEIT